MNVSQPTVAIAGARIHRSLVHGNLPASIQYCGFTRGKVSVRSQDDIEWRQVDMYSKSSTTEALRGVDFALYLVHSMSPSSALNQASFEDTDLLLADNFQKSAETNHLKQIIYIGGILPKDKKQWSRHLISRYEVEQTLSQGSVPVTSLRAGIIVGPGGSSFQILERLVKALPIMACPRWTESNCQPIDITNLLAITDQSIGNPKVYNQAIEVGGTDVTTYRQLIVTTVRASGLRRLVLRIPFFTIGLSKLWVSLFTRTHMTFISPLVESLKHDMTFDPAKQQEYFQFQEVSMDQSIRRALTEKAPGLPAMTKPNAVKNVRSVQRLPNPSRKPVLDVALAYFYWLGKFLRPFVRVRNQDNEYFTIYLLGYAILRLAYQKDKQSENREVFFIVGGELAQRTDLGWLEFRSVLNNEFILVGIQEFIPRLPWTLYKSTQAHLHLWVMRWFGHSLTAKV